MTDNFSEKISEILSKPIVPEKPKERYYDEYILFPDADATAEEIKQILKTGDVKQWNDAMICNAKFKY